MSSFSPSSAISVRRFIETTQSQLTYYGLFNLSTLIQSGELVALFRNSHLGVLYKPHGQEAGLYTLVTDHTFTHEEAVVWEKLDDIEGSSQFVDAYFKDAVPVGGMVDLLCQRAYFKQFILFRRLRRGDRRDHSQSP
jgi:ubiquitin carboxyl-terminal hydrolase MINDY-1/2